MSIEPQPITNPAQLIAESHKTVIKLLSPAKQGRPTTYGQIISDRICGQLAEGISLRTVCKAEDMPAIATIFNWFRTHPEFLEQYARAKRESTTARHEQLEELGDEAINLSQTVDPKASGAVVQAVKLKSDNLKWVMSKLEPKKYADKIDVTSDGKAIQGNTIVFSDFKNDK